MCDILNTDRIMEKQKCLGKVNLIFRTIILKTSLHTHILINHTLKIMAVTIARANILQ